MQLEGFAAAKAGRNVVVQPQHTRRRFVHLGHLWWPGTSHERPKADQVLSRIPAKAGGGLAFFRGFLEREGCWDKVFYGRQAALALGALPVRLLATLIRKGASEESCYEQACHLGGWQKMAAR